MENEIHIVIETKHYKTSSGKVVQGSVIKIYPDAIKDAVMEYLKKYRYLDRTNPIRNYYIELDRDEELMVAVIDQTIVPEK